MTMTGKLRVSVRVIPLSSNRKDCLFQILAMEAATEGGSGRGTSRIVSSLETLFAQCQKEYNRLSTEYFKPTDPTGGELIESLEKHAKECELQIRREHVFSINETIKDISTGCFDSLYLWARRHQIPDGGVLPLLRVPEGNERPSAAAGESHLLHRVLPGCLEALRDPGEGGRKAVRVLLGVRLFTLV